MEHTFKISVVVDSTNHLIPLGVEMWIDNELIHDIAHVTEATTLTHDLVDEDSKKHVLKFVLKNKLPEHTKIDNQGNILSDALLAINDVKFDGIKLGHVFDSLSTYQHNYNGTGPDVEDKFNGSIGCNGTVSLEFTTPVYLWLLENM